MRRNSFCGFSLAVLTAAFFQGCDAASVIGVKASTSDLPSSSAQPTKILKSHIDPDPIRVTAGKTIQLRAYLIQPNGQTLDSQISRTTVNWSVEDSSLGSFILNSRGLFQAGAPGKGVVTAMIFGGLQTTASITVEASPTPQPTTNPTQRPSSTPTTAPTRSPSPTPTAPPTVSVGLDVEF